MSTVPPADEAPLVRFRAAGLDWTADVALEAELRATLIPALAAPESIGGELVKRSLTRSVYRLALAGRGFFLKVHTPRSLVERLKYLVLRSRASAEWNTARLLAGRGIPAPHAAAFAERRVAGVLVQALLLSAEIPDAVPLDECIRQRFGAAARGDAFRRKRDLLARVAALVRHTHDADVLHRDLHAGNIVVSGDALFLIDLHRVRVGPAVSARGRAANLAQLLSHLGELLSPGDRLRMARDYLGPDATRDALRAFFRRVSRRAVRLRERRYVSRTRRCAIRSTGFRRESRSGLRIRRRADFAADLVIRALEGHRATLSAGPNPDVLKADRRTCVTVVRFHDRPDLPPLCVKEFLRPGLLRRLGDLVLGTPARRAWLGSHACVVRGIGTPRPVAIAERGARSWFISEFVAGASRFNDYLADLGAPRTKDDVRRRRAFILAAADFVRRLHAHRLFHRDLSAKNILVRERGGAWEFFLVDVGDVRRGRTPALQLRLRNLGQLGQLYATHSRADRLRFFRRYARGRPELLRREYLAGIDALSRARLRNWLEHGGRQYLEVRRRQGKPV